MYWFIKKRQKQGQSYEVKFQKLCIYLIIIITISLSQKISQVQKRLKFKYQSEFFFFPFICLTDKNKSTKHRLFESDNKKQISMGKF